MADIDQILAGGAGATSRADFSGLADIPEAYWKGRDRRYTQEGRDLFKGGVPTNPDGSIDYGAMRNALFQHGDVPQGVAVDNLDLARQKLKFGQQLGERVWPTSGDAIDQPPTPPLPPSSNRQAPVTVAPPLNRGGLNQQPQAGAGSPRGDQPGSVVGLVSGMGVPDELAGPIIGQVSALARIDPNATIPPEILPRVQQVVQAAVQRMKTGAAAPPPAPPQMAQAQPAPMPGSSAPIQPTPVQTQAIQPVPASQAPTDPTLGGLVPRGRTPEQQLTILRRAVSTGLLDPNVEKAYMEQIKALDARLAPTEPEKAFDAARRNPALDPYLAKTEADKAAAKAVAEGNVKEQNAFIDSGRAAGQRLTTLNTVSNIIANDKSMTLGFGADTALKVKKALQQIGFDVGDLSGAQSIEKLNGLLAAEATKTISSRPSQFEFKTFLANNPGLNMDRAGNMRVISIFSQLAKRDLDLGKLARQNRGDWQNWDNVVETYDKQNPIVDPVTKQSISTNSVIAPAPTKTQPPPGSAAAASGPDPAAIAEARRRGLIK